MIKDAEVRIFMPYEPKISVNHAHPRGAPRYGKFPEVEYWLYQFKAALMEESQEFGPPVNPPMLNIHMFAPFQPGRMPDTSNFRKLPQDVAALVLKVDDYIFGGTDYPPMRHKIPGIYYVLRWKYDDEQPWDRKTDNRTTHMPDSVMYFGPQEPPEEGACIGYGSVYCMTCSENPENWCPAQFDPSVFSDNPCKECDLKDRCPCMNSTKEREEQIELWWRGRVRSIEFERENWE